MFRADQLFAVVVPNAKEIVFAVLSSGYVNVSGDPPVERHVPLIAKHPPERLIPFANDDVAMVDVMLSRFVCNPPWNVDVAVVVAVKYEPTICPTTDKGAYGDVVPIPRLPLKYELAVVVEIKLPTVSCVPVAMSDPLASVVMIELAAPVKEVPLIVTVVTEPESEATTPLPTKFRVVLVVRSTPSSCAKLYPPPPVPRHVPLTETHPPDTAIPPEYVDVEVFVTVKFVSVVVPADKLPVDIEPPLIVVFEIDPPVIVGLVMTVFERLSIL